MTCAYRLVPGASRMAFPRRTVGTSPVVQDDHIRERPKSRSCSHLLPKSKPSPPGRRDLAIFLLHPPRTDRELTRDPRACQTGPGTCGYPWFLKPPGTPNGTERTRSGDLCLVAVGAENFTVGTSPQRPPRHPVDAVFDKLHATIGEEGIHTTRVSARRTDREATVGPAVIA